MRKKMPIPALENDFETLLNEQFASARPTTTAPKPKRRKWTILTAVDEIFTIARDKGIETLSCSEASAPLRYLAKRFELSLNEAFFLALFINMSDDKQLGYSDFGRFLNCSRIRVMFYSEAIDKLVERQLINYRRCNRNYWVDDALIEACKHNEVYVPPVLKGLSCEALFDEIGQLATLCRECDIDYSDFECSLLTLLDNNPQIHFVKEVQKLELESTDLALLVWFCDMLINRDDEMIVNHDINSLIDNRRTQRNVCNALTMGFSPLMTKGLVEYRSEGGLSNRSEWQLTKHVKEHLLQELGLRTTEEVVHRNLTAHGSILGKKLFYNEREQRQIDRLAELLAPARFEEICDRLTEQGLRRGFACLFHGSPGTGKTETVLQIARATGRDIMQVNISTIKSCFVGESEKNIQAIFDRYRALVKQMKVAPILLFNEADAIFGHRMERTERAVDKMENAIQNIILQEMESLEGILIATTNLTASLDPAFERRFLYKIEFSKPTLDAKCAIWHTMLPDLSDEDVRTLATSYDFSGGQIENVARKHAVEKILSGGKVELKTLCELCDTERLSKRGERRPMGF